MSNFSNQDWESELLKSIDEDKDLMWHPQHRIISVFDDVRYDRSDIDLLTTSMRKHIINLLKSLDCSLKRGNQLIAPNGTSLWMPKPSVLGASCFDITRYTPREIRDIYILTPTQTAAYWFEHSDLDVAVEGIEAMLKPGVDMI